MQIELTPEQDELIRLGIQQGRYQDAEQAVQSAMDLWIERERIRLELFASLDEAVASIEAGNYTEYTEETLANLPSEVASRCKARLEAAECASA